jgi:hypothetical protein
MSYTQCLSYIINGIKAILAKKRQRTHAWAFSITPMEQITLEFAKTCVTLQETYNALRASEEKATAAAERLELMESIMKGWHAKEEQESTEKAVADLLAVLSGELKGE